MSCSSTLIFVIVNDFMMAVTGSLIGPFLFETSLLIDANVHKINITILITT